MRSVIIILFTLSQSIAELQILITSFSLYAILPQREYVPNSDLILDTPRFLFKRVTKGILKLIAKRVQWKESVIRNFDDTRWRTQSLILDTPLSSEYPRGKTSFLKKLATIFSISSFEELESKI